MSEEKVGTKRKIVKPPPEIRFDLDDRRKITLRKWKNKTYIDIREFYDNIKDPITLYFKEKI